MNDLISRQAAILAVCERECQELKPCAGECPSIWALESLPSVEPERKSGRWQITDAYPHNVYCSECHAKFAQTHWAVWEDGSLPRNYCPNCGSYNGGE